LTRTELCYTTSISIEEEEEEEKEKDPTSGFKQCAVGLFSARRSSIKTLFLLDSGL